MTMLLIATRNRHKVQEIQAILGPEFNCRTLNDCRGAPSVVEDADTFAGNASKKAEELAAWLARARCGDDQSPTAECEWVLADDSGLEVDALHGAPGVYSARFAALESADTGNSPDTANNAKLLRLLADVPAERRTARFRCVIALTPVPGSMTESSSPVCYAEEAGLRTRLFEGACEGRIEFSPRGAGGFGYDPLFIPDGFEQSFAELGEDVKNRLSHRAQALAKLREWFLSEARH